MELPIGKNQRNEFWRGHVKRLSEFKGSRAKYAEENELSLSQLGYYLDKFSGKSKFAKVVEKKVDTEFAAPAAVEKFASYPQGLPDPRWLSRLIQELMR